MNPLDHPIVFSQPRRLTPSAWHQHIPFAMFLIDVLRPSMFVELGTHHGDSYCAFCQAIAELRLSSRCLAVDTWEGDPQTGFYGPEVLEDLRRHHDPLYGSFSALVQSTFDDALNSFDKGTIDLLHIDGYHTYDSVKHDFDTWLPKLSHRGVVLLHDTNHRHADYGVHRLWDELTPRYEHFEFVHGHGLGVLAVGPEQPSEFRELLESEASAAQRIREFFFRTGASITLAQVEEVLQTQDAARRDLERVLAARDARVAELEAEVGTRDAKVGQLENDVLARDDAVSDLNAALAKSETTIRQLEQQFSDEQRRFEDLKTERDAVKAQLDSLSAKKGVRLLRFISRSQRLLMNLFRPRRWARRPE
jgi:O-antigen biosynthesis protein